jgi:hypothetical protein
MKLKKNISICLERFDASTKRTDTFSLIHQVEWKLYSEVQIKIQNSQWDLVGNAVCWPIDNQNNEYRQRDYRPN